jgi:hypothetical protein
LPCADGQYRRWKTEDQEHVSRVNGSELTL